MLYEIFVTGTGEFLGHVHADTIEQALEIAERVHDDPVCVYDPRTGLALC